ncbi:conserved protein of unknown function [Pseudomonas marincola]|uniref:Uncharacterized protein n=1 Tax=Pseudomonas marincola TaxID=437900 RepID=A0A653DXU9_9PSED|nr:conserved protein of unknown function [Pseudomonas marincola]
MSATIGAHYRDRKTFYKQFFQVIQQLTEKILTHPIQLNNGGEGGIRTPDTLLRCTPLAGERLRPLGHLSATRGA